MILCLSTSSPWCSVAVVDPASGQVVERSREAGRATSQAVAELAQECLDEKGIKLATISLFVADVGPGSFSGVKVGVTMAKTWAAVLGKPVAAVTAFDLISPEDPLVIGAGKNKSFVRLAGEIQVKDELPQIEGYFPGHPSPTFPAAGRIILSLDRLSPLEPDLLNPLYGAEPSISQAKQSHIMGETFA